MSIFLSPNLAIEQIKRNNFVNNSTQLNNEFSQKIPNNNFLPSFDFYTDIKFLTNSNASNFYGITISYIISSKIDYISFI